MASLPLIHGGLWEEDMNAALFWRQPGIAAELDRRGFGVLAPDRLFQAPDWATEARHLAQVLPAAPLTVLPGCPEPPRPEFPPYLEPFLAAVAAFAAT